MNLQTPQSVWSLNTSPLHWAVIQGDRLKIMKIVNSQIIDVNILDRWNRSPLFLAVLANNKEIVEFLLKSNAKVDMLDINKRSVLHIAAHQGLSGCLKILLQAFDKIYNSKDEAENLQSFSFTDVLGIHPLHVAAKLSSPKCLQSLLKYSFLGTIDCQDHEMRTPLHWAAAHGLEENVNILLKNGADPFIIDNQERLPFHWAALSLEKGSEECLKALIALHPSQINKQDCHQATPLHLAVATNNKEKVEILLASRKCLISATDSEMMTPLHYASQSNSLEIAKCLISSGADVNKKEKHGAAPLHYAVFHNNASLVELMLHHTHLKDACAENGDNTLHCAARAGSNTSLILLVNHGASLIKKNSFGETPLHIAAKKCNGSTSTVEVLLKLKAPLDARTLNGSIPLHYAAEEGNSKIVKQLLAADPSCLRARDNLGRNALHLSIIGGHLHLSQVLIETGISSDSRDVFGMTGAHLAASLGFSDMLHLLLENNARINTRDNEGKTALHWACEKGHLSCVSTLLDYNAYPNYMDGTRERLMPLDYALRSNDKEMVKCLEYAGAHTFSWIQDVAAVAIQRKWREFIRRKKFSKIRFNDPFAGPSQTKSSSRLFRGLNKIESQETGVFDSSMYSDYNDLPRKGEPEFSILNPQACSSFSPTSRGPRKCKCNSLSFEGERDTRIGDSSHAWLHGHNDSGFWSNRVQSKSGQIVVNEAFGVSVRLPEGEELIAKQNAWRQVLSEATVTKISPMMRENKN